MLGPSLAMGMMTQSRQGMGMMNRGGMMMGHHNNKNLWPKTKTWTNDKEEQYVFYSPF